MLKYITEKEAGIIPGSSEKFITELVKRNVNLHSVMLLRHGDVFFSEYQKNFPKDFKHRLYSVSKTYVSASVGVAIGEGYFSLDSKICEFFKDKLPENPHPYIKNLTVKDCLIMATPFDRTPYRNEHKDWVYDFFNATPTHRGGSIFNYDTGASLVLDDLVKRTTGKDFNEYLYEKVLKYIGYKEIPECVEAPDGVKWGGSGMLCTTEEFARFARLLMKNGKSDDGKQLIPERYVKEMLSKQIGNNEDNARNYFRGYGYGYQTWMIKDGWAMLGMGNQLAFCFPKEDVIFICTGDDQGNLYARNYIIEFLFTYILNQLKEQEEEKTLSLCLPVPCGNNFSEIQEKINGVKYKLEKNNSGFENVSFDFTDDYCKMTLVTGNDAKEIMFGMGYYREFSFPEKNYSGKRINTPLGRGYRSFAAADWDMPDLLVVKCYAADMYFGVFTLNIRFNENNIDMHFTKTAEWFFNEYEGFLTGRKE